MIGRFVRGIVIGSVIGAAGGLLLAPKSGERTRKDIEKMFTEMKDKVTARLTEGGKFTKRIYDSIIDKVMEKYEVAGEITPRDAKKIREIFERSYGEISKIISKDIKEISES